MESLSKGERMSTWKVQHKTRSTRFFLFAIVVLLGLNAGLFVLYKSMYAVKPQALLSSTAEEMGEILFGTSPRAYRGTIHVHRLDAESDKEAELKAGFTGNFEGGLLNKASARSITLDATVGRSSDTADVQLALIGTPKQRYYLKVANLQKFIQSRASRTELPYAEDGANKLDDFAKEYQQKWISFSNEELKTLGFSDISINGCTSLLQKANLSQHIKDTYKKHAFLEIVQLEKTDTIHLKVSTNQSVFDEFVRALAQDTQACQWLQSIKSMTALEFWLHKRTHHIEKFSVTLREDQFETKLMAESVKYEQGSISEPSESVSISQFEQQLEQVIGSPVSLVPNSVDSE